MDLVAVLVMGLAVWRFSSLLVVEDGPWDVFRRIRKAVHAGEFNPLHMDGERLTPEEAEAVLASAGEPETFLAGLLSCVWCTSMWVAAGIVVAYMLWPPSFWLLLIMALSAVAILLEELVTWRTRI